MSRLALSLTAAAAILAATEGSAACRNNFFSRSDEPRQIVTLLTGKLTYQEAQTLSEEIAAREAPPLEWVDDKGKLIARQLGKLEVVRPMPVRCDDKPSGVVMIVTFLAIQQPYKTMNIKLPAETVVFEEQPQ
ncbi:MAG TPA: hypothetical protein VNA04_08215 [Thermoanaerobaculia bacterium]|nr:hypothetical protein [Thermoanaerobaculia bacterium]